jgi:hypothetical protein
MPDPKSLVRFIAACLIILHVRLVEGCVVEIEPSREKRSEDVVVVPSGEICPDGNDEHLLVMTTPAANGYYEFRFQNRGETPIHLELMRDGDSYRTDYPLVRLIFRFPESDVWNAPVMVRATLFREGLERVRVAPGESVEFSTPIARYLPGGEVEVAKIQLGVVTSSGGEEVRSCASSTEFEVERASIGNQHRPTGELPAH